MKSLTLIRVSLAAALAAGASLHDAVLRAAAAGALACTRLGVVPALPYVDDVDRMTVGRP
jgi:ribokinase